MSLINKMLQDLDQRGSGPSGPFATSVKLTPQLERGVNWSMLAGGAVVAVFIAGAGAFAWRYYKTVQGIPAPTAARMAAAAQKAPAPVAATPAAQPLLPAQAPMRNPGSASASLPPAAPQVDANGSTIVPAIAATKPAMQAAVAGASAGTSASAPEVAPKARAGQEENNKVSEAKSTGPAEAKPAKAAELKASASAQAKANKAAEAKTNKVADAKAAKAGKAGKAASAPSGKAGATASSKAASAALAASTGVALTNAQRAEADYRRGLAALQDGRNGEAIAALEQAVRLEPTHEAARQTVVGLLVEARRPEEAMRHLQIGLTLEPRQPAMAMLMARLQIERGVSGIETLMRTLPYATGNSEYHALLAGALARESRHQEAAEQYRQALRGSPQNGIWLIGLAISLQSEKRDGEALDAFKRAKASGNLAPELAAFADRKINALSR